MGFSTANSPSWADQELARLIRLIGVTKKAGHRVWHCNNYNPNISSEPTTQANANFIQQTKGMDQASWCTLANGSVVSSYAPVAGGGVRVTPPVGGYCYMHNTGLNIGTLNSEEPYIIGQGTSTWGASVRMRATTLTNINTAGVAAFFIPGYCWNAQSGGNVNVQCGMSWDGIAHCVWFVGGNGATSALAGNVVDTNWHTMRLFVNGSTLKGQLDNNAVITCGGSLTTSFYPFDPAMLIIGPNSGSTVPFEYQSFMMVWDGP